MHPILRSSRFKIDSQFIPKDSRNFLAENQKQLLAPLPPTSGGTMLVSDEF
jgi:hypothetical protein